MDTAVTPEWKAGEPATPRLHEWTERLGRAETLDRPAETLSSAYGAAVKPGRLKDALSGTWLGHALHPLLTDATLAFFMSASTLDLIGGSEARPAAKRLIQAGLASVLPTAVTGMNEWADTTRSDESVRRIGLVHAGSNVAATALYAASLLARRAGNGRLGAALGFAGLGALTFGGHLGGHLSYSHGVGVDQTTFAAPPREWTRALAEHELRDGDATAVYVDGVRVLVTRQGGRWHALADRCCHRGGPLHRGEFREGCVTCPWHGSTFRLEDGSVVRGPAAYPQPAYDVRIEGVDVLVRPR